MAKVVKKKKRQISAEAPVSGSKTRWVKVEWVSVGVDISVSSVSLAGIAKTKSGKIRNAKAISCRWSKEVDYFERMKQAAQAHDLMHELFAALKVDCELHEVYIAIEEPVAIGHLQRGVSMHVKQQLEICGAFMGGLLRYGWLNLHQIQWQTWAKLIADDLGITTHHTKWNPDKHIGKYRAQQWVEKFHPKWDGHWPDLVQNSKHGLVPRGDSKAKGKQSDDRYEALGVMNWMKSEIR